MIDQVARERLFGWRHAFDDRVTLGISVAVAAILIATPIVAAIVLRGRDKEDKLRKDISLRYRSWLILAPLMIVPVLLGAAWTILAVGVLSLLSHREFARATGLFRDRLTSALVVVAICAMTFAALDNWFNFFVAILPLGTALIAAGNILSDRPKGYVQRVALGVLSLSLFGAGLGHFGLFANDIHYRPILLWLIATVQLNDIFAYICGKSFGRRKLLPVTSPGKTLGGALGALVLTTALAGWISMYVFRGTMLATIPHAVALGLMIAVLGQFGDLVISSVKRDVGIKDMGSLLPGHGGLLDRFDSLLLTAPAVYHYVNFFLGVAGDQAKRILSAGAG